jgi:hypothetical protein
MNEIISEVLGVFAKQFPLHYKDALIEMLKEEAKPKEEDPRLLPPAPIPDYELKSGAMTKVRQIFLTPPILTPLSVEMLSRIGRRDTSSP